MNKILASIKTYGINNSYIQDSSYKKSYKKSFQSGQILLTPEKKLKNSRSKLIFFPDSNKMIIWNILNFVFLLYIGTIMPYFISFGIYNNLIDYFEKIIDVYYIIDIFINFNCAYYEDETLVQKRSKIAIKYILSYFLLDLITAIPLSWFMSKSSSKQSLNKVLRILKIPKLFSSLKKLKFFSIDFILKIFKLKNIWKYKIQTQKGLLKSLQLLLTTYFFLHVGACIFAQIGQLQSLIPNTWIYAENLQNMSNEDIYISAIYYCFVVLTTVGYGDITSHNTYERLFTIIWMIFGIAFYSFIISFITFFFTSRDNKKSLLFKKIEDLRQFSKKHKITKSLKQDIVNGLQFSSLNISYRWLNSDFQIFRHLPLELKYELFKQIHKELFECPVFHNKDKNFICYLINLLKPAKLKKGQYLWQINDQVNYIVFLTKGQFFQFTKNLFLRDYNKYLSRNKSLSKNCYKNQKFNKTELEKNQKNNKVSIFKSFKSTTLNKIQNEAESKKSQELNQNNKQIEQVLSLKNFLCKVYINGSFFGDEEILMKKNRQFCVQAATDVEFYILSKVDFEKNLKAKFPQIYEKLTEWTIEKIGNNNQAKQNVLTFMRELVSKFNKKLATVVDINNIQNSQNINQKTNYEKIQTLKNIYYQTNQDNPIESHFKDLKFPEVSSQQVQLDEQEKKLYQKIKTPGLQKIYQEWKILKLQKIQANLQEQQICEIKSLVLFPEQEQILQNRENYVQIQKKYQKIMDQTQKSKNLLKKLDEKLQKIIKNKLTAQFTQFNFILIKNQYSFI